MSRSPQTDRMLRAVRRRVFVARWVRLFMWCVVAASAVAVLLMPAAWLLERVDVRMTLTAVFASLCGALLVATLLVRRPSASDAARFADEAIGTKDLFLTVTRMDDTPQNSDGYAPLVLRDAEAAAKRVDPRHAVPIPLERSLGWAVTGLAAAILVAFLIPRFDPFGTAAAAEVLADQKKILKELDKVTEERKAVLKKKDPQAKLSEDVDQSVEQLKQSLKQIRPAKKNENLKMLSERQKDLGQKWRKTSAENLKDLFQSRNSDQDFGRNIDGEELKKWTKELQEGSAESLKKAIDQLQQDLQQLAKTTDPVERQQQLQKVEQRLKQLERFAKETANNKPLAAALKRAMQQLDSGRKAASDKEGDQSLSTEALESMKESLELSKMELEEIAQSARDLKELEKALQTLQMAKKAAEKDELDGQACENCVTLEDYQEFYQDLLAEMGLQEGAGNDQGMGGGEAEPEDETASTGFKTEQSKSAVTAGKVLLSMQSKGLSDTGEAEHNYASQINNVKQGVSEAILQEQVPPGYHEEIKKYFDTLKPPAQSESAASESETSSSE